MRYSVRDFGALGDGRADDTDAIQDALRSAHRDHVAEVLLPPGSYVLGRTLMIPPGVSLVEDPPRDTMRIEYLTAALCLGAAVFAVLAAALWRWVA